MIYSVDFKRMAEKINPLAVCRYLADTGWKQYKTKKNDVQIYQIKINGKRFQTVIPLSQELADYSEAIYDVVKTIADVERKPLESVFLYLLNPNTDIIKIRLQRSNVESGNILFDDAINLYDNAKKLLAATAMDIINPKKIHYGRIDDVVQKFLSDCRFGQTEIGSYIVSVVCPFAEISDKQGYQQLSIFSDEDQCANSLTRKVTNRVMKNICCIKQHIDSGNYEPLYNPSDAQNIISANFYEALNGLNAEDSQLEFTADWSPIVKNSDSICNKVAISYNYFEPVQSIVKKLKGEEAKSSHIVGRIKSLDSSPSIDTRSKGKIAVVYVNDDNNKRTVTTELNIADYDKAIEAHEQGKYVQLIGNLTNTRRPSMQCESFSVIE